MNIVRFRDAEGVELPGSRWGGKFTGQMFESELGDTGPLVSISVPESFEAPHGEYRGYGCLVAPAKELFEDYIATAHVEDPVQVAAFSAWLKDFAARLDAIVEG